MPLAHESPSTANLKGLLLPHVDMGSLSSKQGSGSAGSAHIWSKSCEPNAKANTIDDLRNMLVSLPATYAFSHFQRARSGSTMVEEGPLDETTKLHIYIRQTFNSISIPRRPSLVILAVHCNLMASAFCNKLPSSATGYERTASGDREGKAPNAPGSGLYR